MFSTKSSQSVNVKVPKIMHFLQSWKPEDIEARTMNFTLAQQHREPPARQRKYRSLLIPRPIMISFAKLGKCFSRRNFYKSKYLIFRIHLGWKTL